MPLLIIVLTVVIDQISKYFVALKMSVGSRIELIPNFFNIRYVTNKGAAFGMLANQRWLFIAVSCALIIVLFIMMLRDRKKNINVLPEALIIGGALGNLIDRILLGGVRDFLEVPGFAIMNLADWFISIGIFLLIVKYLKQIFSDGSKKEIKEKDE